MYRFIKLLLLLYSLHFNVLVQDDIPPGLKQYNQNSMNSMFGNQDMSVKVMNFGFQNLYLDLYLGNAFIHVKSLISFN